MKIKKWQWLGLGAVALLLMAATVSQNMVYTGEVDFDHGSIVTYAPGSTVDFQSDVDLSAGIYLTSAQTYATTTTAKTLVAADAGVWKTSTAASDDPVTFNLPEASTCIGAVFTFIDMDATAAADVSINPDDADSINGDTAGDAVNCTTDAVGQSITLMAVDATNWTILGSSGTWAAQ